MVLPVLGLLGLAAAAGAKPHYDNYAAGVQGRANSRALDAADPNMPRQEALFRAGLMNAPEMMNQSNSDRNYGLNQQSGQRDQQRLGMQQQAQAYNQMHQTRLYEENVRQFDFGQVGRQVSQVHSRFPRLAGYIANPQLNVPVNWDNLGNAVSQMESGGNYNAIGPMIKEGMYKGQQAIGKYQVMPGNLPEWGPKYLGRAVTAAEFAESPELQEQMFKGRMSEMIDQHGVADAVSMWHSGRTLDDAINANAKDQNMDTASYVNNIMTSYENGNQRAANSQAINVAAETAAAPLHQTAQTAADLQQSLTMLNRMTDAGDPASATARLQVQQDSFELKQNWIDERMQGREPSEKLQERLETMFPDANSYTKRPEVLQRFYRMVEADYKAKAQYAEVEARVEAGQMPASALREVRDGLAQDVLMRILNGTDQMGLGDPDTVEGFADGG